MSEPSITPEVQPALRRRMLRHRTIVKLGAIFVLAIVLLIPLALLMPVVSDRATLRDGAVADIESGWGHAQTIIGPVLVVPYSASGVAYVLPDELKTTGVLAPEQRRRGIYAAVVYSTTVELEGTFHKPSPAELGVPAEQIHWGDAYISVAVSDLRGTGTQVILHWDGAQQAMLPGSWLKRWPSGLHVPVAMTADNIKFALAVPLHGSEGVKFAPLGVHNELTIRSTWQNPRFAGAFLPGTREVTDNGFSASWSVSNYGRDFGQVAQGDLPPDLETSLFGVDLLPGVDSYRCVDRAVRYGVLFIVLAFMSFFLFEVVAKVRIHPFQYGMVGLALGVFFLILLALSELVPFVFAYSGAATVTVGSVVMYMVPVLKTGRRTGIAAALLGASFAVLWVVLQAEDYALLAGSLVVFAALAVTMQLTRKLDWYAEDATTAEDPTPAPTTR
jgi:inner membrane protein